MNKPPIPEKRLRPLLESQIVAPAFEKSSKHFNPDRSLPQVMIDNQRRQAQARIVDALVARGSANVAKALLQETEALMRDWAEVGFDPLYKPVRDYEIRRAEERDLVLAEESGDVALLLEVREQRYRKQVTEAHGVIEMRGIQASHRVMLALDRVYIPMSVTESIADAKPEGLPFRRYKIDAGFITAENRLMIVGVPGSGKSTLLSWLATAFAGMPDSLPVVVPVRTLQGIVAKESIAEAACIPVDVFESALTGGRCVLMIDGLDEAKSALRSKLMRLAGDLVRQFPTIRMVCTCRPYGSDEKPAPFLRQVTLAEFDAEDVSRFIDKWCIAAEESVRKDPAEAVKEAKKAASDLQARLVRTPAVMRIACNPLLASILCIVHRFQGRSVPEHRVALYEKCTDALLYEWDRSKFAGESLIGELDAPAKRLLLSGLAARLHERKQAELPATEVEKHFARCLPDLGRPAAEARTILDEIQQRSGVLVEKRPGYYGFAHLSFQEYLTALEYVRRGRTQEMIGMHEDKWWHEPIALAAGMPGKHVASLFEGLLKQPEREVGFLLGMCLNTATEVPSALRRRVESRLAEMLPLQNGEDQRYGEIGVVVVPMLAAYLADHYDEGALLALVLTRSEVAIPVIEKLVKRDSSLAGAAFVALAYGFPRSEKAFTLCRHLLGSWLDILDIFSSEDDASLLPQGPILDLLLRTMRTKASR